MGNKGGQKTQKALSVEKVRFLSRKEETWTQKGSPGPHSKTGSVPLGFALRNILGIVENAREAKRVTNTGKVKVNGTVRKDIGFPVGLFDVVDIEEMKKRWRVVFDRKGRIHLNEIKAKGEIVKLSKITGKFMVEKGKQLLATNDGFCLKQGKEKLKVGASVKVELPAKKVLATYELKKGNTIYITGGRHVGTIAKVLEVVPGTMRRPKTVNLEQEGETFQTTDKNVFVVGEKKADIDVLEAGKND